jgi:murein DD-endopeptidase MepM/ murein hydrolase activator NlpD
MNLAGLYSWDIDFTADVSIGDSVTVVYEERLNQESSEIVDTKIIAAQARISGKDFYAFRYGVGDEISFYDYGGTELAKSFLRTPLAFGSVSSGYTQSRVNPVTRVVQPHRAIDYAAPAGTAIYATADGVVSLAGWKDNAYGYTVEVKHTNGYKTQYAHMSEVAKGIKRNSKVIQGETIGYVGSSGISTGPHLQYALFKDGTPVNPLSDDLPIGTTLEGEKFDDFIKTREILQAKLSSSN